MAVAVVVLVYAHFMTVQLTVDGRSVRVRSGTTVGQLISDGLAASKPGDLLAVTGQVAIPGGGGPIQVHLRGRTARPSDSVYAGDDIRTSDGRDLTESVVETTQPIPMSVRVTGRGPLVRMVRAGAVGSRRVSMGEVSGSVVSSETITAPTPMVLIRAEAHSEQRIVALTFDDGPWPGQTDRILDVLKKHDVKATFFVIGRQAKANPRVMRRIAEEGHSLGGHTYNHKALAGASPELVTAEVGAGQRAVRSVTGVTPKWFRPPGGGVDGTVYLEAKRQQARLVLWSVDPQDWRGYRASKIANDVIRDVRPGAVVLLHDGGGNRSQTLKALPWIIRELKERGYVFVTLDQMVANGNDTP